MNTPGRTRTPNLRIRSPRGKSKNPEKNTVSRKRAAPGAARSAENDPQPADLDPLTDAFAAALAAIPEAEQSSIVKHIKALAKMSPDKRAAILTLTVG